MNSPKLAASGPAAAKKPQKKESNLVDSDCVSDGSADDNNSFSCTPPGSPKNATSKNDVNSFSPCLK